jgi:hypothetical protein
MCAPRAPAGPEVHQAEVGQHHPLVSLSAELDQSTQFLLEQRVVDDVGAGQLEPLPRQDAGFDRAAAALPSSGASCVVHRTAS